MPQIEEGSSPAVSPRQIFRISSEIPVAPRSLHGRRAIRKSCSYETPTPVLCALNPSRSAIIVFRHKSGTAATALFCPKLFSMPRNCVSGADSAKRLTSPQRQRLLPPHPCPIPAPRCVCYLVPKVARAHPEGVAPGAGERARRCGPRPRPCDLSRALSAGRRKPRRRLAACTPTA